MLICLLLSAAALADVQRGDRGEEVYEIQQLLFETGFLFEEPDGAFGRNTESAVRWFQESWNLPVTGVVTQEDRAAMYDCWHSLFNPDDTMIEGEPLPDDQLEPQPLSPEDAGDCPAYCIRYTQADGGEHIEYCDRHASIAEAAEQAMQTGIQPETSVCRQWEDAILALYEEWMGIVEEDAQPMIASSQATFLVWLNQQRVTLNMYEDESESKLEPVLRSQCIELCGLVQRARQ